MHCEVKNTQKPLEIELANFDVYDFGALDILRDRHQDLFSELLTAAEKFYFTPSDILSAGGSKGPIAHRLDNSLRPKNWIEKKFIFDEVTVNGQLFRVETHKFDCCKGRVVLENEWNNKDPFFHRDLNDFDYVYAEGVIDCGIIITRSTDLHGVFRRLGGKSILAKYGQSTTHHSKLIPIIARRKGNVCPLLVLVITERAFVE